MSKRKNSKNKGYITLPGGRVRRSTIDNYRKAVKNYNERIRYAKRKFGNYDYLPKPIKASETLKGFTDGKSIRDFISDINKINISNLTPVETKAGVITKGELKMIKTRIKRENKRRAQVKKLVDKQENEIGYFKTDNDKILMPIDIEKYNNLESLRRLSDRISVDYRNKLAFDWKDRYVNQVTFVINQGLISGLSQDDEIIVRLETIKRWVLSLDNTTDITRAAYAAPSMDITVIYYSEISGPIVSEMYNDWNLFMDSL
ncbi:MAG: hypothetical protein [Podoviridae sp. ctbd591]|nr:MAG: hypothetical protein [Podoviridae sp. ctbd591]